MSFIAVRNLDIGNDPVVKDRPDLGIAIVYFEAHSYPCVHLNNPQQAHALAEAFTKAAELLDAQTAARASASQPLAGDLVGRLVENAHDDSPCPIVGKVTGQIDAETLEVQWGDAQRVSREPFDALRPARERAR